MKTFLVSLDSNQLRFKLTGRMVKPKLRYLELKVQMASSVAGSKLLLLKEMKSSVLLKEGISYPWNSMSHF
jgi:hypothetical protein